MMKIIALIFAVLTTVFIASGIYQYSRPTCDYPFVHELTISTLKYGEFAEWIPQMGTVELDTFLNKKVFVPIDELYLPKISKGLRGVSNVDGRELALSITEIHPKIVDGRFQVVMQFDDGQPLVQNDQKLRIKIGLSQPSDELLLPVGGFYSDTRGTWIFVIQNDTLAVKRQIKLGRRNTEYFEVMEGLKQGEEVITSDYGSFLDRDSVPMDEIVKLYSQIYSFSWLRN